MQKDQESEHPVSRLTNFGKMRTEEINRKENFALSWRFLSRESEEPASS